MIFQKALTSLSKRRFSVLLNSDEATYCVSTLLLTDILSHRQNLENVKSEILWLQAFQTITEKILYALIYYRYYLNQNINIIHTQQYITNAVQTISLCNFNRSKAFLVTVSKIIIIIIVLGLNAFSAQYKHNYK